MNYISAEKLIAEIERLRNECAKSIGDGFVDGDLPKTMASGGAAWVCEQLLSFITSLQQEKLLAVVPGFLDRNYHEEIRFSINDDSFTGDSALLLPEDSVSYKDLGYDGPVEVELLIRKV